MKPTDQIIQHPQIGDCLRASIASLFELDFQQVPHFQMFDNWQTVLAGFIWSMGYNWTTNGDPNESMIVRPDKTINGFTEACVPSKNYPGAFHSVVIDTAGFVAHDPHPKRQYQGINVFDSGDIVSWLVFEPNENYKRKS